MRRLSNHGKKKKEKGPQDATGLRRRRWSSSERTKRTDETKRRTKGQGRDLNQSSWIRESKRAHASGQTRTKRRTNKAGSQPQLVEQRAKRAASRDQTPHDKAGSQPQLVEQRAKRADRRDQWPQDATPQQPPACHWPRRCRGGGRSGSSGQSWDRDHRVLVAGGRGPRVGAVVEAFVVPGGVGFHAVVGSAQGCEVPGPGLTGWSAVLQWVGTR